LLGGNSKDFSGAFLKIKNYLLWFYLEFSQPFLGEKFVWAVVGGWLVEGKVSAKLWSKPLSWSMGFSLGVS
jgi:hypothetical protein